MKRSEKYLVFAYLLFLLGLRLSGTLPAPLSTGIYVLSYLLPTLFLCRLIGGREEALAVCPPTISRRALLLSAPLFFPTVLLLFGISALTTLALGAFGLQNETALTGNAWEIVLTYLLLPAVLEELLFRYLPLTLLAPYGKRSAVLFSALCFSLTHCDFFQMPYALVAGILFAALDLATESVLPSVLFHLSNNALSVPLLLFGQTAVFRCIFFWSLGALALLSLLFIFWKRETYRELFFSDKGAKEQLIFTKSVISLAVVCVFFAVLRLISLST